ncbi:hypothetical protein BYT27DRAFT_7103161 [Phlegmacium glaucopus]|nr:hypothetical protein BYT27DRAFT_7103161 [Phlegmacium glaucopus]
MKRKQGPTTTSLSQAKKTKLTDLETGTSALPVSLQELLDFSRVKTEEDIECRFNHIAKILLHESHLVVVVKNEDTNATKEIEFEILEAEFYLQSGGCHEDPFTHGSEEQKISGTWYFHRAPRKSVDSHRSCTSLTGYRGGSRKGMDLTIAGTPPPPVLSKHFVPAPPIPELHSEPGDQQLLRGGILLRSLRQLGLNSKVISGPSLLVDRIISISGASSIADLVENKWAGDTCAFVSGKDERSTMLFLRPVSSSTTASPNIYFSPRIGLDLSHPGTTDPAFLPLHPRIQFLPKPYRFFTHPEELVANGRPQTFLGVLFSCISTDSDFTEALKKPLLSQEIASLMALKESNCAKYLAEYVAGREGGVGLLNSFVGSEGKGASSSPSSYLRMMGALSNLILPS